MSPAKGSAGHEGASSSRATEEKTELKKRWAVLPQQKEILDEIFNSGIESPDRDLRRQITELLQSYGDVSESNVYIWFQNKRSRAKKKRRSDSETSSMPTSGEVSPIAMPPPQEMDAVNCAHWKNTMVTVAAIQTDSTIVHTERGDRNQNPSALTVFINGIPFDITVWPLNVKAMFGEKAILLHSSGQPVAVDQQGFILEQLEHRGVYKLVCV